MLLYQSAAQGHQNWHYQFRIDTVPNLSWIRFTALIISFGFDISHGIANKVPLAFPLSLRRRAINMPIVDVAINTINVF